MAAKSLGVSRPTISLTIYANGCEFKRNRAMQATLGISIDNSCPSCKEASYRLHPVEVMLIRPCAFEIDCQCAISAARGKERFCERGTCICGRERGADEHNGTETLVNVLKMRVQLSYIVSTLIERRTLHQTDWRN